ncbi:multidrug transporter MatE [Alcanivorax sp. PN-3]|nr:multidrug transporter MatE [Alcanivorax sp. PN-3]CUR45771.1 Multi antimicrobial extrusion protein (Na(+)/drug antiporter), MATE family of MDR efflux pumps [Alloalcanivorax xenomutans]
MPLLPIRIMSIRRKEYAAQLALALPILGGQLAQTANGFVDTMMAGRVGAEHLAAVAVGASIWVPLFLFMTGVLTSATPILSRHLGGEAYHRVNPLAQQALWLGLGLGLFAAVALRSMSPVLHAMDVDPAMLPLVQGYLEGLSWGMPGAALMLAMRSYTEAMRHTRPVLWISIIGLLINIPTNYVLIYGKLGFPAMGGVGCGWATSVVMWSMALMMGLYIRRHPVYQPARLNLRRRHLEFASLAYMLRLGLPVGLSIFFEVSIFAVIALLISSLGPEIVAGHQIALNFTSLIFMVPLSFSLAATVRVGHARGRHNRDDLNLAVGSAIRMVSLVGVAAAVLLVLIRHWVPWIYTRNPEVIALASHLLLFAALYQISDAIQVVANGCLRGFEDTAWPMVMTLFAYWGIGLPLGYALALTDLLVPAMGPSGFWIGLVAGLTCAAILLGIRLRWRLRQPLAARAGNGDQSLDHAA